MIRLLIRQDSAHNLQANHESDFLLGQSVIKKRLVRVGGLVLIEFLMTSVKMAGRGYCCKHI